MKTEDINVTSTHISLLIGDTIVSSKGSEYEVVDIDYDTGMLSITVFGNNYNITFDAIAIGDYKKVVKHTNTIKTTNGDLSLNVGDAIINNGRLLEVIAVSYDSGLVHINENGGEYTISLSDIDAVDYIDSITQIVTTNPRKNRLIIIANGLNPQSCDKDSKDDYVAVANSAPRVGDFIVDSDGNKYEVGLVDYDNLFIVAISKDDEQHTIHFDRFSSGEYSKVLNSSVKEDEYIEFENIYTAGAAISLEVGDVIIDRARNKYNVDAIEYDNVTVFCSKGDESYTFPFVAFTECDYMKVTDSYVAVDNNPPKIGDEITGAEGNKYKVVCIDYNDYTVTVRSTDGEEFDFNLVGFESSVYKKVLK